MKTSNSNTAQAWATPQLTYRGTVGQILQGGEGKLSIAGSDPGEGRCEKPHADDCASGSGGPGGGRGNQ